MRAALSADSKTRADIISHIPATLGKVRWMQELSPEGKVRGQRQSASDLGAEQFRVGSRQVWAIPLTLHSRALPWGALTRVTTRHAGALTRSREAL